MNGYELSRKWFDYAFENPEKIKPAHGILYFFCIEHCNRLGWKKKFGLPTTMAKEAIGIRSYNTYINTLKDLVDWGFIEMLEKSKNQYSSNIIALSNFDKAHDKALDKALIKHVTKQRQSTSESIGSIDKQLNKEQVTKNKEQPSTESDKKKSSLHKDLIEMFCQYYKSEKGIKYEFQNAKDGIAIKGLISKIKRQFKNKHGQDPTEQEILNSFSWLIKNVTEWVYNNFTLANINGQFNQIVDFAKNGNSKKNKIKT